MKTRQRKVIENGATSMLPRNDVIDMEGQRIKAGRKPTIFTPVMGALPDFPGNFPIHGFVFSARRALDLITASRFPTCK